MRKIILLIFAFCSVLSQAQEKDSTKKKFFFWDAYAEFYYNHDFNKPAGSLRPSFIYNHKKTNTLSTNLAFLKAGYNNQKFRIAVAGMLGDYGKYNLAAEPDFWQHVLELNAGIKISKTKDLWLDIGVMPSHIGFESAIGGDAFTLSRSLVADNSPYLNTGAALSYLTPNKQLKLSFLLLNGWQTITNNLNNNPKPAAQITYMPDEANTFNYSTFFGKTNLGTTTSFRTYHNLYWQFKGEGFNFTAGLDLGTQDVGNTSSFWAIPTVVYQQTVNKKLKTAIRAEYMYDPDNVVSNTFYTGGSGAKVFGFSWNADYAFNKWSMLRAETRFLRSGNRIFLKELTAVKNNNNFTIALIIRKPR